MRDRPNLLAMAAALLPVLTLGAEATGPCPGLASRFDVGTQWHARGLAADANHIVTVDYTGLTVWSDADPRSLQPVTSFVLPFGEPWWFASDVVLDGEGHAFMQRAYPGYGLGPESVLILDLTVVPPRPLRSLTLPEADTVFAIDVENGLLAASGENATYLYDVHRADHASLVATIARPYARPVFADGLLVVVDLVGLTIYDLTDPTRPTETARLETFSETSAVHAWAFGHLLVASSRWETHLVDFSDPSAPVVVPSTLPLSIINMVEVDGRIFAASLARQLMELNLDDPAAPVVASAAVAVADGLAGRGSTLWATDWETNYGILTYDLSAGLELVSWDQPAAFAYDIAARDGLAAVALGRAGVRLLDLSDPTHPSALAHLLDGTYSFSAAIDGNLLFVAGGPRLKVVDITDPTQPQVVGIYTADDNLDSVRVTGGLVIVTTGRYSYPRALIIDVTDPSQPTERSSFDLDYFTGDVVTVHEGTAYVGSLGYLLVYDLADPSRPRFSSYLDVPVSDCQVRAPIVSGSLVYVPCTEAPSYLVDVSDPSQPAIVGEIPVAGFAFELGDGWIVAHSDWRVSTFDLEDPLTGPIRSLETGRRTSGVAVIGNRILALTDPFLEILGTSCDAPAPAFDWVASGAEVWFQNRTTGWASATEWDFGDGTRSTLMSPRHVFPAEGVFTVTLTAGGTSTVTATAEVVAAHTRTHRSGGRIGPP